MYRYWFDKLNIFLFVLCSINAPNAYAAVTSAINQQLQQESKMVSPAFSKKLQEEYEKAKEEVEITLEQLNKARQEHDMPGVIRASQRAQEAQVRLKKIEERLHPKK